MECKDVMNAAKFCLFTDDLTATAIDFMMANHMGLVPVVDRDKVFVGLLSGDRLMHHMLPKTVSMMRGKKCAGYIRESSEELLARLEELKRQPIKDLVDRHVKVAHPDTGLIDVLINLSEKQHVVPILERQTNKLLGAISFFSVLKALAGEQP